ncbi:hypothetical protein [Legionella drancourtii]|uniref:Uncharacterized protein n=1 Tax=Legionella drancourtii LLAP12 TaxID=658187 RepID=G9ETI5_9GAMM|nr:hypothetical protein [Legionella drancourtii]EHL29652.1 hypothetical protein LDG_8617 [Legionella drancourtii LLAP12]
MATNETELQIELDKIKNNAFDVKGHFKLLFANLLAEKQHQYEHVSIVEQLIDEDTLGAQLQKEYPGKDYVLLFYAHKPHATALHPDPQFKNDPRAHTSLLLCKVNEGKIGHVLNIDGYNYPNYADPTRNPHIKQRLVIQAQGNADREQLTPLQKASWQNMNCVLYSFTFAEQILALFQQQPELMSNLFSEQEKTKISADNLFLLHEGILAGMTNKYVRAVGPHYIYDQSFSKEHHDRMRAALAKSYELQFTQAKAQHSHTAMENQQADTTHHHESPVQPNAEDKPPVNTHKDAMVKTDILDHEEPLTPQSPEHDKDNEKTRQTATIQDSGTEKQSTTHQDTNNYNFLLNAGIALSATLAIGAFVVAAIALAAVVIMPPVAIAAVITVGAVAGLVSYGLFNTKNKEKPEESPDNTATTTKQSGM